MELQCHNYYIERRKEKARKSGVATRSIEVQDEKLSKRHFAGRSDFASVATETRQAFM
jgi:hypothetical protein